MADPARRIEFYPFAYALKQEELSNHCWYCLGALQAKARCTGCDVAYFCNKTCHVLGWKDHRAECGAIRKHKKIADIETRMLGRIALRQMDIIKGRDAKIEKFYFERTSERSLLEIWSHKENIQKDTRAMKKFEEIYEDLKAFYDEKYLLSKEQIFEFHCRDYINRHAISDAAYMNEIGKGLYLDLCAYDHSCRPNTIYTCKGFVATLRSLNPSNDIRNRNTTFYSYIDLLNSQPERLKQLKDTWYFDCKCSRCIDPEDYILTSLKCPHCPKEEETAWSIFGNHSHKDKITSEITCSKCEKKMDREYVLHGINTMRFISKCIQDHELEQMPSKSRMEFLQDILERAMQILPKVNVYFCTVVQHLIPLVEAQNHAELLRLHLISEPCIRVCYPANHPGLAFHLRAIGILYSGVRDYPNAIKYVQEALDILLFVMDDNHPMTRETMDILQEIKESAGQSQKKKEETVQSTKNTQQTLEQIQDTLSQIVVSKTDKTESKQTNKNKKKKKEKGQMAENKEQKKSTIEVAPTSVTQVVPTDLFSESVDDLPDLIA